MRMSRMGPTQKSKERQGPTRRSKERQGGPTQRAPGPRRSVSGHVGPGVSVSSRGTLLALSAFCVGGPELSASGCVSGAGRFSVSGRRSSVSDCGGPALSVSQLAVSGTWHSCSVSGPTTLSTESAALTQRALGRDTKAAGSRPTQRAPGPTQRAPGPNAAQSATHRAPGERLGPTQRALGLDTQRRESAGAP